MFHNAFIKLFQMKADNAAAIVSGEKTLSDFYVHGMNPEEFEEMMSKDDQLESVQMHQTWVQNVLGIKPGKNAVVVNGKVCVVGNSNVIG